MSMVYIYIYQSNLILYQEDQQEIRHIYIHLYLILIPTNMTQYIFQIHSLYYSSLLLPKFLPKKVSSIGDQLIL